MQMHELDLLSLAWGIILAAATVLTGLAVWSDFPVDLGVLVPVALIATGGLVLIAALVRRPTDPELPSAD